jgi:SAM-dependent methyltransferase
MMDQGRLATLARIEQRHFWFAGRDLLVNRLVERYLERGTPVLDLGAGSGRLVMRLRSAGYKVVGIDRLANGPGSFLVRGEATLLPFPDSVFSAILLFDLLEHCDEQAVLQEVRRVLRPQGRVILTVPAFPGLWSYRDVAAGHLRRYSGKSLRRTLQAAGFQLLELRYYQFVLFPVFAASRFWGRLFPSQRDREDHPPGWANALLARLNRLEVKLGDFIRWPWGSSLVAVCQRVQQR